MSDKDKSTDRVQEFSATVERLYLYNEINAVVAPSGYTTAETLRSITSGTAALFLATSAQIYAVGKLGLLPNAVSKDLRERLDAIAAEAASAMTAFLKASQKS